MLKGKYVIASNPNNHLRVFLIPYSMQHRNVNLPQDYTVKGAAEFKVTMTATGDPEVVVFGESYGYGTKAKEEDQHTLQQVFCSNN